MDKKIVWVLNRLITVGGGEKLMLEGVAYYRSIGYDVYIITWEFSKIALFEGYYENKNIINLEEKISSRENIAERAFSRFKSIIKFRKILKQINPNLIIVQGEYDVATTYIATLFTKLEYTFLIFGQIFQYPHDLGKYALIFKKNLQKIINSQQGYKETISLSPPKSTFINKITNEIISIIRYFAVRKAKNRFTFSTSVQWETKLLFGVDTIRNQGAFKNTIFNEVYNKEKTKIQFGIPDDKKIILSFSRLDKKKRIEIIIESLVNLPNEYYLVIAGTGEYGQELVEITNKNNLQKRVLFLGYIEEKDANAIKASSDIFVSKDIGDFDISPLEAMALGTKAIVASEFDLDSNLSNLSNLLVCSANPIELSETIKKIDELELNLNYQKILQQYTWEEYFEKILKERNVR